MVKNGGQGIFHNFGRKSDQLYSFPIGDIAIDVRRNIFGDQEPIFPSQNKFQVFIIDSKDSFYSHDSYYRVFSLFAKA